MAHYSNSPPRSRNDDVNAAARSTNKYMGERKTRGDEPPNHNTSPGDPYKWEPGQTVAAEGPGHGTAENDPYMYEGGGSYPRMLSGAQADGTFNPPGKIGGYADQMVGTKNPAYQVVSGEPPQEYPRGQAGSLVESGPSFAPYRDEPPPSSPTDFSKDGTNQGV